MNVVILHHHFNLPEQGGALRSYYLASALVEKGIAVTVITRHNRRIREELDHEGMHVVYLPVPYDNSFGFGRRIRSFLSFAWKSFFVARRLKRVDRCYAISTPLTVALPAVALKWTRRIPYYFEVGDLWPDAPIELRIVRNKLLAWALYRLERFAYRHSDGIVVLSRDQASRVVSRTKEPVHLIPNMADTAFFQPTPASAPRFTVLYAGAVGYANGLDYLLDGAKAASAAHLEVDFIICGKGATLDALVDRARNEDIQNISFVPFRDRSGVRSLMEAAHAVFICYRNAQTLSTGSPNKYFDGLAAGKLILANFGGWMKTELEETGCGVSIDPGHPAAIVPALTPFLSDASRLHRAGQAARALAERTYARHLVSKKFVELFEPPSAVAQSGAR